MSRGRWIMAAACAFASVLGAHASAPEGGMSPSRRATLLASHGEPRLAWDALRSASADTRDDAVLAVRLLTELDRPEQAESLLARASAPTDDRAVLWRSLQRARLNLDAGRTGRALEVLASAPAVPDDPLTAYLEYVRAQVALGKGEAAQAVAALETARPLAPEALLALIDEERARSLRSLGRPRDALAALDDGVAHAVDGSERRRLLSIRYDAAREVDDPALAEQAALVLLDEHRAFPEAQACALAVTRPLRQGEGADISTRLLASCAEVFATRGRADDLARTLRALEARTLAGSRAEHRRLLWGEYHYLTGGYARAIALASPAYADPDYKRRSTILLARALRAAGRRAEAAAIYEGFARDYPNDAIAADALYAAASLREQAGQDAESARLLDELRRAYPSSFQGWAAAMRRAHELEKGGQMAEAQAIFEQWLARSRRTDEAALFYLSRLHESTQESASAGLLLDELRRVNPYSFYVAPDVTPLARGPIRDATGAVGASALSNWLADAAGERERAYQRVVEAADGGGDPLEDTDADARAALERARAFLDAGFRDWAERELEFVRRRPGNSPELSLVLAKLYEEYAMPWRSVRVFERARVGLAWETRREHAEDFRYLMYPLPYPAQVFEAAGRTEVPPHLIYAIIREESRFEASAVSRAGAVGLMQLMPETARRVARTRELGSDVDDRLQDPAFNVSVGTWYASDLLRAGDGSVAWMLAAYNAGPGAAKRWLLPGSSGDDAIEGVEAIDYRETRGYVKRVVESANVYQALYFKNDGAHDAPR